MRRQRGLTSRGTRIGTVGGSCWVRGGERGVELDLGVAIPSVYRSLIGLKSVFMGKGMEEMRDVPPVVVRDWQRGSKGDEPDWTVTTGT